MKAYLAFTLLFLASPLCVNAQGLALLSDNLVPANNLSQCHPGVRQSIEFARKRWGWFEFTCFDGNVEIVFMSTASMINVEAERFVETNLCLVSVNGASVTVFFEGAVSNKANNRRSGPTILIQRIVLGASIDRKVGISANNLIQAPGVIPPDRIEPQQQVALRFFVRNVGGFRRLFH